MLRTFFCWHPVIFPVCRRITDEISWTPLLYCRNTSTISCFTHKLDFCLSVHHQLRKVIQMNQLDAIMIYWSIRSAQHVSGNILPIIRSVRLRYLVSCCCGGQGDGERQRGTMCTHSAVHIVPRCRSPSPCSPKQQDTICCKKMLGKVIQMNQLDAAMIYWSIRSAQHVSRNILLIIRSVRLIFLQHMVSCCCGGQGDG